MTGRDRRAGTGRAGLLALAPLLLVGSACAESRPAEARVVGARELGVLEQAATIQGRDGGESALAWGRSIWVFGDTVLNAPDAAGSSWHHNSWSYTADLDAGDGIGSFVERPDAAGAPAYLLPPTADEQAFNDAHAGDPCAETPCGARWAVWPTALVFDEPRDRVLVFYDLIYAEPGEMNFRGVGSGVATWDAFDEEPVRPVVAPGTAHPTLLFGEDEPGYGTAAVLDGDDLYVFGCRQDGFDFPCTVARVPAAAVLDRAAWRSWDGAAWSTSLHAARPVLRGAPIVGVFFNRHLERWCAVHSAPLDNDVVLHTAPALAGPWSDPLRLFTADRRTDEGWVYDALPHAEYSEQDGRVLYVTHSRPTGVGWFGAELALVRVELE